MKLQFFSALLSPGFADLRATHVHVVRALPHAIAASNDAHFQRAKLACRWRRNRTSGKLEARWSTCK